MKFKYLMRTVILSLSLAFILSNCGTITRTSVIVQDKDSIKMGYSQLKVLLLTFYDNFSSVTEESANYIIYNTDNNEIKKMALRWKINTISEARRSVSIPDPYAALIDVRAYSYQLNQFFVSGAGRNYFGKYQHVAVETSDSLINAIDNIALRVISRARFNYRQPEFLEWVASHPISGPEFSRESTISLFVKYLGDDTNDLKSSIGTIEEALTDIRSRLSVYSQALPKQAQWQAELLIEESLEREDIKKSMGDLDTLAASLYRIERTIAELDILLGRIVNDSFKEIDRQRLATLDELKSERQLLVDLLQKERQIVLNAISVEREKTVKDAENITNGIMSDTSSLMYDIVDHVFYRVLQLLVILGILFITGMLIMKKMKKA